MLVYDGEAISSGLLVWQGAEDFFDRRLAFGVAPATSLPTEPKHWQSQWAWLWGTVGVRKPPPEMQTARAFDGNNWMLERLAISFASASTKRKPGADLSLLGVDKKKHAKPL